LEGRLLPTLDDYAALEKDRGRRFVEQIMRVVPRLMAQAKEQPEAEQSASIGGSTQIGVAMEVVETLEEVYLRVSPLNLRPAWLEIILAAVFGDRPSALPLWAGAARIRGDRGVLPVVRARPLPCDPVVRRHGRAGTRQGHAPGGSGCSSTLRAAPPVWGASAAST
jgi:hypothetical protein